MLLAEYVRDFLSEEVTQKDKILNLQPDDYLLVYHGTGEAYAEMINGIDATREHHRSYGGPRHEGIFVTTDPAVAHRFASYGQVVLEILVQARDLKGTDYSGQTVEKQVGSGMENPDELWRSKYPNTYSPYLTATLLQDPEPQALLLGVVRPEQIKRVQWKGEWHTRENLLNAQPEYHKRGERTPVKLERSKIDPTDGSISVEEFFGAVGNIAYGEGHKKNNYESLEEMIGYWYERYGDPREDGYDEFLERIVDLGWRHNAAREIVGKLRKHYS